VPSNRSPSTITRAPGSTPAAAFFAPVTISSFDVLLDRLSPRWRARSGTPHWRSRSPPGNPRQQVGPSSRELIEVSGRDGWSLIGFYFLRGVMCGLEPCHGRLYPSLDRMRLAFGGFPGFNLVAQLCVASCF
jgi:hypothetical protein